MRTQGIAEKAPAAAMSPRAISPAIYKTGYSRYSIGMTIEGYFDGKTFVPLEKLSLKPNQKVQITILDEFLTSEKQKQIARKRGKGGDKKDSL